MKQTQAERLAVLPEVQQIQIDKACRRVAFLMKRDGKTSNGASLSFLNVLATSLALVNVSSLKAWHAAFQLLNERALSGDEEAKRVVSELALVLEDAAKVAPVPDDDQTDAALNTDVPEH